MSRSTTTTLMRNCTHGCNLYSGSDSEALLIRAELNSIKTFNGNVNLNRFFYNKNSNDNNFSHFE